MSEYWKQAATGRYEYSFGAVDALVWQDGELWRNAVYWEGMVVDQGEWNGRSTALKNANTAIRRARALRTPLASNKRDEDEEYFDDE